MELFGLIFALPIALITSAVYCNGAAFVLTKLRQLRWPALLASLIVVLCFLAELAFLRKYGAKAAYSNLGLCFTLLHFVAFFLGPPAIVNILLSAMSIWKEKWKFPKIAISTLLCWFACMSAAFGHILIDEAIAGIDSGTPFYMLSPKDLARRN